MKTRIVATAVLLSALAGAWLPSLWLPAGRPEPATPKRSLSADRVAGVPAGPSLTEQVRSAGSFMAQLQAVVAGAGRRGAGLAQLSPDEWPDLNCEEEEELMQRLAGEALAESAADGGSFLKSLADRPYQLRAAAIEAWAERDPDAALLLFRDDRFGVDIDLLTRLATRNPDKALAMLKSDSGNAVLEDRWAAVAAACVGHGEEKVMAVLAAVPHSARLTAVNAVMCRMADDDPAAALEWAAALPREWQDNGDRDSIFAKWGAREPAAALRRMFDGGFAAFTGDRTTATLAASWLKQDEAAFLQWAGERGSRGAAIVRRAAEELAEADPQRALALLATAEQLRTSAPTAGTEADTNSGHRSCYWKIGCAWAAKDAPAALAWARSLPDEDRSFVLAGMVPELTKVLTPGQRRTLAAELGVETAAGFRLLWNTDPEQAKAALLSMPATSGSGNARSLVRDLIKESPAAAAELITSLAAGMPLSDRVSQHEREPETGVAKLDGWLAVFAGQRWAASDPAAAAAWAAGLPEGKARNLVLANVAISWGRYDAPAAVSWAQSLTGDARKAAVEQLTSLGIKVPD